MFDSRFMSTGLGYVYTLRDDVDDNLLTLEITNLRSRNGSLYGMLTASTGIATALTIPGTDQVMNAEIWLFNPRARAELAGALASRIPSPNGAQTINFENILEEVTQRVIQAENRPMDVKVLGEGPPPVPVPYLIEALLPANQATILYGAGGVGKSILAAALASAVQTGTRWLGFGVAPASVLYLDWETDEADINSRVRAAATGLGLLEIPKVQYVSETRPIEDRVAQIAKVVAEQGIGLVIIDSVGMAMASARDGSDPSEGAIRFFRALRALNSAVLAIDHVAGEDMRKTRTGAAKPYGSVYKWNSARNALELRERKDPDQNGVHLVLRHRKSNLGPRVADINLTMNWSNGRAAFHREHVQTTVTVPLRIRVEDILTSGPATPRAIADLLSENGEAVSEMDVRQTLKGLLAESKVQIMADGTARKPLADVRPSTVESGLLPPE